MVTSVSWSVVLVQLPSEPSRHRVAVWRALRSGGAVPVGSGAWLLPSTDHFLSALDRVSELVRRGGGSFVQLDATPRGEQADEVLTAAFAKVRRKEWAEFEDDCGKFETEIDKEFAKRKFTLGELEEEEQSLERLRRWSATLHARDVLGLPEARSAADRLQHCEQRLDEYAEQVYAATQVAGEPDDAAARA